MSEVRGVIMRGNRATIICSDCGRFIKHDQLASRYASQVGEPYEPEVEYVHRGGCPPKRKRP